MNKTISTPAEQAYLLEFAQESLNLLRELKKEYPNYYFSRLELGEFSIAQYQKTLQNLDQISHKLWDVKKVFLRENGYTPDIFDTVVLSSFVPHFGTSDLVIDLVDHCVVLLKTYAEKEKSHS